MLFIYFIWHFSCILSTKTSHCSIGYVINMLIYLLIIFLDISIVFFLILNYLLHFTLMMKFLFHLTLTIFSDYVLCRYKSHSWPYLSISYSPFGKGSFYFNFLLHWNVLILLISYLFMLHYFIISFGIYIVNMLLSSHLAYDPR